MSVKFGDMAVQHVDRMNTVAKETFSPQKSFLNGMFAGALGPFIPSPRSSQTEFPNTKAHAARLNGIPSDGIILTSNKTKKVSSSCFGPGLHHPIDFHFSDPAIEHYKKQQEETIFA